MQAIQILRGRPHLGLAALITLGILLPSAAALQANAPQLPEAATILDGHVAATGGKQAHMALTTRKIIGELDVDIGGHQFVAKIEKHAQAPDKTHTLTDGPDFSRIIVCDGRDAWERWSSDGSGQEPASAVEAGLITKSARLKIIEQAPLHAAVEWRKHLSAVKTVGFAKVGGKPAYEVSVTNKNGRRYSQFYDKENGRLVKATRIGEKVRNRVLDTETFFSDYREFDGVWLHTTATSEIFYRPLIFGDAGLRGTEKWTYFEVEHGVQISPSLFALPEELQKQASAEREKRARLEQGKSEGGESGPSSDKS